MLFGCWLLYFVFGLSVTSLAPLVGEITSELSLSRADMGMVLGAWQFVYIFLAIPVGFALQRLGAGKMLILAAVIIAASGISRSLAESHWSLLAAVAVFGLGGPVVSAGVPQTVSKWFTGNQRGLAMGIYITAPPIAGIVTYSLTQSMLLPALGNWRAVLRLWALCAAVAGVIWLLIWLAGRRIDLKQATRSEAPRAYRLADAAGLFSHRNTWLLLAVGMGVFTIDHGLRNWLPEILVASGLTAAQAGYLASIAVVCGGGRCPAVSGNGRGPATAQGADLHVRDVGNGLHCAAGMVLPVACCRAGAGRSFVRRHDDDQHSHPDRAGLCRPGAGGNSGRDFLLVRRGRRCHGTGDVRPPA